VDESGNQTVVFGRKASRPFNLAEMKKFYERDGELYTVENVFTRDGKLATQSGEEVKPSQNSAGENGEQFSADGQRTIDAPGQ